MILGRRAALRPVSAAPMLAIPACSKTPREPGPGASPSATSQTTAPPTAHPTSQASPASPPKSSPSQSSQTSPTQQEPRPPDPWEEARRNGVSFRAVGHEPGWFLEITSGTRVLFVTNYGVDRYEFGAPTPPSIDEHAKQTVCRARSESLEVVVVVDSMRCLDPMTGYAYQSSVQVILGGRTYRGCGRTLKN